MNVKITKVSLIEFLSFIFPFNTFADRTRLNVIVRNFDMAQRTMTSK